MQYIERTDEGWPVLLAYPDEINPDEATGIIMSMNYDALCRDFALPIPAAQAAFWELWHKGYKTPDAFNKVGAYQATGQAFRNAGLSLIQADELIYHFRTSHLDPKG